MIAGVALLAVGLLGWRQRLPRNRFAGIRTPAALRSDAAFIAANRMAAPPILAADVIYAAAGGLALGTHGPALTVIVGVAGTGAFALALAGGFARPPSGRRDTATGWWLRRVQCRGGSCGMG